MANYLPKHSHFQGDFQRLEEHPRRKTSKSWRVMLVAIISAALLWRSFISWGDAPGNPAEGGNVHNAENEEFDWFKIKPSKSLNWTTCYGEFQCARLSLPLDYLTPAGPNAEIALAMLPATDKENYKGSILINPGGPGGPGAQFLLRAGKIISTIVGPQFDIVGFDPRGTGATLPSAQCFNSDSQFMIWAMQDGPLLNTSDGSFGVARSRSAVVGKRCAQALGGNGREDPAGSLEEWGGGRFMSTPSVATDMLRIVEQLGQEKLQYWGFSYGSVLGQYFSAMYPDKVGRVIIDGVYDGEDYRKTNWMTNLEDTDAVLSSFYTFCHKAGPEKCPLYASNVKDIKTRVDGILNTLRESPIPIPFSSQGPFILTDKEVRQAMFGASYSPLVAFGILAEQLVDIESNNQTSLSRLAGSYKCSCADASPWISPNDATTAIACSDGEVINDDIAELEAHYAKLSAKSAFAAPIWAKIRISCTGWKVRSKWQYTEPLSATNTSHPILLISPRFDPVCPLKDARRVHTRFNNSALLVQNSYGHCSLSAPSICTAKAVRAYFSEGKLPEEGTVCEANAFPFIGVVDDGAGVMSAEDAELLEALNALSQEHIKFGFV